MHITVLLKETLQWLEIRKGGVYIDGTLGGGGHSEGILKAGGQGTRVLGLDRDGEAIARSEERLSVYGGLTAVRANFADMAAVAEEKGFKDVDGIVLDLGVSSFQLDASDRGFSFSHDGPLDMRMDNSRGETAAGLLERMKDDWRGLARILGEYGEEPRAAVIARAVLAEQRECPIASTARLAGIVEKAVGGRRGAPRHPATRTFQALRIAVNGELEAVAAGVEAGISLLAPGGAIAVISFHSLEDRIVKRTFAAHAGRFEALQEGGSRWNGIKPAVTLPFKKPVTPDETEAENNPRSRSAKLRVARRVAE